MLGIPTCPHYNYPSPYNQGPAGLPTLGRTPGGRHPGGSNREFRAISRHGMFSCSAPRVLLLGSSLSFGCGSSHFVLCGGPPNVSLHPAAYHAPPHKGAKSARAPRRPLGGGGGVAMGAGAQAWPNSLVFNRKCVHGILFLWHDICFSFISLIYFTQTF